MSYYFSFCILLLPIRVQYHLYTAHSTFAELDSMTEGDWMSIFHASYDGFANYLICMTHSKLNHKIITSKQTGSPPCPQEPKEPIHWGSSPPAPCR